jgi:TolB-like protein/Tfp pilus assembly protein PilF
MSHGPDSAFSRWIKKYRYFNIALLYLGTALVIMHFAEVIVHGLHIPAITFTLIVVLVLAGLPIVLLVSWATGKKEAPPVNEGVKGRKRKLPVKPMLAGVLSVGIFVSSIFIYNRFYGRPEFTGKERSIAVLPFDNISSDKENEYFSDGITEEITSQLSNISDLRVIARTSSALYKDSKKSIKQIAKELNVTAILEGSVQKSGNEIRITVQLIDANTQQHLWSEKYDRDLKDIFQIQSEVAGHIAQSLRAEIFPAEKELLDKKPTEDLEAFNFYLQGRYFLNQGTEKDLHKALGFFEQAITKDPGFAKAYAGKADVYLMLGEFEYLQGIDAWPRAEAAIKKALELDETSADAHNSRGHLSIHQFNWKMAELELKRALELSPAHAEAHHYMSQYLAAMGRMDESISEILFAQKLDPLSLMVSSNVGQQYYRARRMDEALVQIKKTLELQPDYPRALRTLARIYFAKGMKREAFAEFEKSLSYAKKNPTVLAYQGSAYGLSGDRQKALNILNELKQISDQKNISGEIALVYIGLNEKDQAFAWLEKAIAEKSVMLIQIKVDPEFDPIRSDPRYLEVLKKMGLASE